MPCFDVIHAFILLFCFLLHFSCRFACYLDTHTQMPIFPNWIIPPPIHCTPNPTSPHIPDATLRPPSRQRCQIDEEHGRCSPHDKQTPPIWPPTWQRTGTGAQCRYTPLTWSANSPTQFSWESDLSHGLNQRQKTIIYIWKNRRRPLDLCGQSNVLLDCVFIFCMWCLCFDFIYLFIRKSWV